MHRIFVDRVDGGQAHLSDPAQLHYLKDVLRLKVNDEVIISDGRGNDYLGSITGLDKKQAVLSLKEIIPPRRRQTRLTIACAIPKGSRMDDVIDHLTQLGVERIIPLLTERVVVKLDDAKKEARLERWQKLAASAARQSQRSSIPAILPATPLAGIISNSQDFDLKLIPTLAGDRKLIKDVIAEVKPKDILVLIGPEGDFTPEEVALATSQGFIPVSLGDTVLRVAAAAIAVASYLKFALGD